MIKRRTLFISKRGKTAKLVDISGVRYGRLVAKAYVGRGSKNQFYWRCKCDCGEEVICASNNLFGKNTNSCGCLKIDRFKMSKIAHGHASPYNRSPEYMAWSNMKNRCYQTSSINYDNYGGRGINICKRWLDGENGKTAFQCFLLDMGIRPSNKYSLDRIDSNGNYELGNCRWATRDIQGENRRTTIYIIVNGENMMLTTAMKKYRVSIGTYYRAEKNGLSRIESFAIAARLPVCVSMP